MAKLPKLTKDELRERQEKECAPQGRALARELLTGALAESRLEAELFRHEGERGRIVRKAFSTALCQAIDLEEAQTTTKVCNAIRQLLHDDRVEAAASRLDGLLRDYERQKQQERAVIEEAESTRLRDLGISGSAIRLNLRESERWRQKTSELQRAFRPRVDATRQELDDRLSEGLLERS